MSLTYAILAGISRTPRTGYELGKAFQGSIGFFWSASHQQIYRELERIHERGWATIAIQPQSGKPDRKVYSLTEDGHKELKQWIEAPTEFGPAREPWLVKLFVGYLGDREKLIAEFTKERERHKFQLTGYLEIEKEHFTQPGSLPEPAKFQSYTLKYGISFERAWLAWSAEVLDALRKDRSWEAG